MIKNCLTHPDEIDYVDCKCALHIEPFDDWQWQEFRKLEHYNTGNWWHSCYSWLESGLESDPPLKKAFPLGDGRVTVPLNPFRDHFWPIPLLGEAHQLMLVLRHWVEGEPDEQFGRRLSSLPAWLGALEMAREWRDNDPLWRGAITAPDFHMRQTRQFLQWRGLPGTAGTARYFLHQLLGEAAGLTGVHPTRGLLVTSLCLAPLKGAEAEHGQVVTLITSVSSWVTDALRRKASQAAGDHAHWWKARPQSGMVDLDLRRLNRRPPDSLTEVVLLHLEGKLERREVERRAIAEEQERCGRELHPLEQSQVRRRVAERIRYQRLRLSSEREEED